MLMMYKINNIIEFMPIFNIINGILIITKKPAIKIKDKPNIIARIL